ncbi:collagen alpha-4(VI) chain-like [Physella acuta]|uniref:collagen alpha-4(VI) chain-like n=1 Tax=Physella acuta TaxID=109671 RepID=UPI0027DADD76|nr:collagen alpha-4(VI) chain-like [Physella acuta]
MRRSSNEGAVGALDGISKNFMRSPRFNLLSSLRLLENDILKEENGDRKNVPNAVVIITDTNSQQKMSEIETLTKSIESKNGVLYTIGIGLVDKKEMESVASSTENVFTFSDYGELERYGAILRKQISACCADARFDLVFVLDASTSVTAPNFELMKDFMKDFLFEADIDNGNVRVGVVIYSTGDYVQFQLKDFSKKEDVYNAIDIIPYRYGNTNTADALKTMRTVMFTAENGDRPGVDNIAIVVTDGISNINNLRTIPEADKARAQGIHIYPNGINLTDTKELDGIANKPLSQNRFSVQKFTELSPLRYRVFSALCGGKYACSITTKPEPITSRAEPFILPLPKSDCALGRADLVIVVDSSTSVSKVNFKKIISFLKDFVSKADIDSGNVRVGLIMYSTEVYPIFDLNTYTKVADIIQKLDTVDYNFGSTNIAEALEVMRTDLFTPDKGDRAEIPNIALVLIDGLSTVNPEQTVPNARLAQNDGIHIYTVGIGLSDYRELDGIASPPAKENSFKVASFDDLVHVDDMIFAAACPEEFTFTKPSCVDARLDLVFVLDASTSVTAPNFELMKDFVKDFLFEAAIDNGNVRVGVVIYSTGDYVQFQLKDFSKKEDVYNAIDIIPYRYGNTNTADALKTMRTVMFTAENGDRPGVDNIAIVVTDGVSNINNKRTIPEAEEARAQGIHIYAIGIGLTETKELDGIASKPVDENRFAVQDFSELRELRHKVLSAMCSTSAPVVTQPPPPPPTTVKALAKKKMDTSGLARVAIVLVYLLSVGKGILGHFEGILGHFEGILDHFEGILGHLEDCCDDARVDLVFVLDASTSVTVPNFEMMKDFMKDLLFDANVDNGKLRVGVIIYSTVEYIQFQLKDFSMKQHVYNGVDSIQYRYGNTNTADALKTMRTVMFTAENGDRPGVDNIAIVVTDGVSDINNKRTIPEAEEARAQGIHIYAIGIGLTETKELDGIASKPVEENTFFVQDFSELVDLRDKVFSAMCNPPPPRRDVNFIGCADARIDIVFVLDASTSVTAPNFELMKDFMKDFLLESNIDNGNVRVGVIIYSDKDYVKFQLKDFSKKEDVYNAIDNIPYSYGSTNTADGLKAMRTVMFTAENGDRPGVDNIAIVVTDGASNINSRRTIPEAEEARAQGIHIYAIGIGLIETKELDGIASKPVEENRFAVHVFSELITHRHQVFSAMSKNRMRMIVDRLDRGSLVWSVNSYFSSLIDWTQTIRKKMDTSGLARVAIVLVYLLSVGTGCVDARVDLVFVLDASTSVTATNFEMMKDFMKDFLFKADIDNGNVRVGVIIYSTVEYIQFQLKDFSKKEDVYNAIDIIPYRYGDTNTADALKTMRTVMFTAENGDRPGVDNIAIVVTDGVSDIKNKRTIPEAEEARAQGIHIYAIGIGLTETKELDGIASKPVEENSFFVQDFSELVELRDKIFSAVLLTGIFPFVCSTSALIRTEPPPPPPTSTVKAVVRCADARIDIVFVLDASFSVGVRNFKLTKDFVKDFLLESNIDNGNVRVGVVIYSTEDYIQFQLKDFSKKEDVYNAIDNIPYRYGSTNTADGLKTMRTVMFTAENGDRPGVDNIAIVVTDGYSNINSRRTIPDAEEARAEGIHIYAIGIGLTEIKELDGIASKPVEENRFAVQAFSELRELRHKVFSAMCKLLYC